MFLYILRHAEAEESALSDTARKLTEKGWEQAERVARFLEKYDFIPSLVLSSPVRRAHDTASTVARHLKRELETAPWLACGMQPETALSEFQSYKEHQSLLLTGHEPDLSRLIAFLVGIGGGAVHMRKAMLAAIDLPSLRPASGRLEFLIPCKLT